MAEAQARLRALRGRLIDDGVDGFILPRTDMFGSEYLPAGDERVAWLTGFTGSAARVVVLADCAALFTDGRYTLQAKAELDPTLYDTPDPIAETPTDWLRARVGAGRRIGYDPMLHLQSDVDRVEKALKAVGAELVALDANPVDAVWSDQPEPPVGPIRNHPPDLAGESSLDKRSRMLEQASELGARGLLVSTGDGVSWLLNIRGSDIPFNPVCLGLAVVLPGARSVLLTEPDKAPQGFAFEDPDIHVRDVAERTALYGELEREGIKLLVDPGVTHKGLIDEIRAAGVSIVEGDDPVTPAKARKNAAEIAGARRAHVVDGAAVTRFLTWLDQQNATDELQAVAALEAERRRAPDYLGPSFDTISGAGPNGAIVHYRVDTASNRQLEAGGLYLVDSGAQYPDATTDITRTVAVGTPSYEMRRRFTLVLKGHIALATVRFPERTTGSQLDVLARHALWQAGLDYEHGTGHGVGSHLNVHEGPQRISKRGGDAKLEPGMIVSNEPGYYAAGSYGIRIENLLLVVETGTPVGGELSLLGFETLSLAPIDQRLIEPGLLDAHEIAWLDAYHARVRESLEAHLGGAARDWLHDVTAPLAMPA